MDADGWNGVAAKHATDISLPHLAQTRTTTEEVADTLGQPREVHRMASQTAPDRRFAVYEDQVVLGEEGGVRLRGVVPDDKTRKTIVSLAQNTVGVERVMDELAVPAN